MSIIERVTSVSAVKPMLITIGVLIVACILLGAWGWVASNERDLADSKLALVTDDANNNAAAVTAMRDAVDACIGKEHEIKALADQAAADLEAALVARTAAANLNKKNRDKLYADDPSCGAWGYGPVCVDVSDSL